MNGREVEMAFYVVWDAEVTNRPGLEPYVAAVSDTIAKHGGRYLALVGWRVEVVGSPHGSVVVF